MIVVHHLNNSRSQRIVWLLEELGLEYEIAHHSRDAVTKLAPPELLAELPQHVEVIDAAKIPSGRALAQDAKIAAQDEPGETQPAGHGEAHRGQLERRDAGGGAGEQGKQ